MISLKRKSTPDLNQNYQRRGSAVVIASRVNSHDRTLQLKWAELRYAVPTRQILARQSGHLTAGTITALMGPSGAGKSTLLNAIGGRINRGLNGRTFVTYAGEKRKVRLAFVPQLDAQFPMFTVRETLTYASKLCHGSEADHEAWVANTVTNLNLDGCEDSYLKVCSGGQKRRVSMAVELISDPDILLLDEPTTGLDSDTAALCITILKSLARQTGITVVASIHQPSNEVFQLFQNVYFLSARGQCVYFGPPKDIVPYLADHQMICPKTTSAADFMIDVAYGKFGTEVNNEMEKTQTTRSENDLKLSQNKIEIPLKKIIRKMNRIKVAMFYQIWVLMCRAFQMSTTRSTYFRAKIFFAAVMTPFITVVFEQQPGIEDGCWATIGVVANLTAVDPTTGTFTNSFEETRFEVLKKQERLLNSVVFHVILIQMLKTIHIGTELLDLFAEMPFLKKELNNCWYSLRRYFIAKFLAEIPGVVLVVAIMQGVGFYITQQRADLFSMSICFAALFLFAIICDTVALITALIVHKDVITALLATIAWFFTVNIFAGILVPIQFMPFVYKVTTHANYVTQATQTVLTAIYGFGRCPKIDGVGDFVDSIVSSQNPAAIANKAWKELRIEDDVNATKVFSSVIGVDPEISFDLVNATSRFMQRFDEEVSDRLDGEPSYIMSFYSLNDNLVVYNLLRLIGLFIVLRIVTYALFVYRTRISK